MSRHNKATQPFRPSPRYIGAMLVLLLAGALFWWAGQAPASALIPLVALLR